MGTDEYVDVDGGRGERVRMRIEEHNLNVRGA